MMKHYNCRAWGLLILRVVIGVIFIAHGWQKIDNMAGTVGFFASLGLPAFLAYVTAWVEFIGGIAFVLGVGTKLTGYLFAIIMAVAIFKLKLVGGLTGAKGYEFELLLLAASLCISFAGPGIFALGQRFVRAVEVVNVNQLAVRAICSVDQRIVAARIVRAICARVVTVRA